MPDDRVTETTTGPGHTTTIIERRGSGGGLVFALVLLVAVIVGAIYLYNQSQTDRLQTKAATEAARDIGDAAKKVGDSAEKAADKIN